MKNYELKDAVLNAIASIRKREIATYGSLNNNSFVVKKLDLSKEINNARIDDDRLISALDSIISDGLINQLQLMSLTNRNISLNGSFFDALDNDKGWYTTKHYKEQMELELLVTQLDTLTIELRKLESNRKISSQMLTDISSITTTIGSCVALISKIKL